MAGWWLALLLLPPALWLLILLLFADSVRAAWREPVLRYPVLIFESDDWGPGPQGQAAALGHLMASLSRLRDTAGRHPVMTLGLTLSLPDSEAIGTANFSHYRARTLADPAYSDILTALRQGMHAGVFAPQLHGMAHYWPPALMRAAEHDIAVRAWILDGPHQETEALPSPLQSRWTDAGTLPSQALPQSKIEAAVAEEVALYHDLFGAPPTVVVPPTFVWTEDVEAAWAACGVGCIITPGRRCSGRDAEGHLDCQSDPIHNGQRGRGGLTYLVRDRYFEPARGHRSDHALAALSDKTAQGRPCLLETHRFNFTGTERAAALAELNTLLERALSTYPELRFISTAELAGHYCGHGDWLVTGLWQRLTAWAARMLALPRFARLSHITGLNLALALLVPAKRHAAA